MLFLAFPDIIAQVRNNYYATNASRGSRRILKDELACNHESYSRVIQSYSEWLNAKRLKM